MAYRISNLKAAEPEPPMANFDIYVARTSPARLIGWVKARTADEALSIAAEEYDKDERRLLAIRRL